LKLLSFIDFLMIFIVHNKFENPYSLTLVL